MAFASVDLAVYGLSYSVWPHVARLEEFKATAALPSNLSDGRVAFSLPGARFRSLSVGNAMLLAGASRLDGYAGLPPARVLDYRDQPDRQMCRLYLSMMEKMNVRLDEFGDAAAPLAEV